MIEEVRISVLDKHHILAVDQGTSSTRALIFTKEGAVLAESQLALKQYFSEEGWVEHDAEEIWQATQQVCREVLEKANLDASQIAALGICNQRETTILWDRDTHKPIHRAIVWQDRRTTEYCKQHLADGREPFIQAKTGLLLDPYFSASKIHWLLEEIPEARALAEKGKLAFGTIDSFLIWRLTGGKSHVTDASNASRTSLFNIHKQAWDDELLDLFAIPANILPEVLDSSASFGLAEKAFLGEAIPITGVLGDQQAALVGQTCFQKGMIKSTYGTGCFLVMNTGNDVVQSRHRLLSTVAYRLEGKPTYALEGSIFVAGAAVQWLKDALCLIEHAHEAEKIATQVPDNGGVYLVPAFTGLGAPYWDPMARGAIFGLTRGSGVAHIVRAALEAVCYQTRDLLVAMREDGAHPPSHLRVDGGMSTNGWLMQFLADILGAPVEAPQHKETSAWGAALMAGLQVGLYDSLDAMSQLWHQAYCFEPNLDDNTRQILYQGWHEAVQRVCTKA